MRTRAPAVWSRLARGAAALLAAVAGLQPAVAWPADAATITVFAAASLKTALDEASAAFARETGDRVVASYAASPALARQIEHGAPADVFISADRDWMDHLASKGLIRADTRVDLLGNRLVLIAPSASTLSLVIAPGFALATALGDGRLALADVTAVPAGKYAKAALQQLGVWSSVVSRLAPAENVRAALAMVALGEAPLGIVYRTDAAAEPKVRIVAEFPPSSHPPIVYPIAVTTASAAVERERAKAFVAFLRSPPAREILERQGFVVLD